MRIKVPLALLLLTSAAVVFSAQQDNGSSANSETAQARDEIQGIERLLPQLADRGPAMFELAHDYALWGNLNKALSLLKQCVALNEGFDPEGDAILQRLNHDREYTALVKQIHRQFPPVHRARLAYIVPENNLIPEGLAADPSRHIFYMGSLSRKKIVKIGPNREISDFIHAGQYDLQSICGIKVEARKTVLEYRSEFVEFPTTGAIDEANFYFMANTHLDNWKDEKIADPKKLEAVRIAVIHLD